jgi:hypothetical protein
MFELYKITMPDGRAYIGVSKVLQIRVRNHRRSLHPIGVAIREVGFESVRVQVLARGARDYIYELEAKAIEIFGTRFPAGLNVSAGGFGCRDPLPETRAKISAANMGHQNPHLAELNRSRRGQKRSSVSVLKTATGHRGMKRSAETRAKLSAKAKSRCHPSADSLMRRAESMRATIAVRRAAGSLWSAVSHGPRGARGPYKKREITQWL